MTSEKFKWFQTSSAEATLSNFAKMICLVDHSLSLQKYKIYSINCNFANEGVSGEKCQLGNCFM